MADQYLAVWQDARNSAGGVPGLLYIQRIGADGVLMGSESQIATTPNGLGSPDVVWNAVAHEYMVVWEDSDYGRQIFGRRLTENGWPVGEEFAMPRNIPSLSYTQYSPSIAWNGNANQYFVTWDDHYMGSGTYLYGQRVNPDGTLLGISWL